MASQKQIDANRANAQKSSGPRSMESKAKTRLNAMRDGITGQVITLSEEDLPFFEKLKAELIADLAPKTVLELRLASGIAWDTWRLDRLRAVEMNMYALGNSDPDNDVECPDSQLHTTMTSAVTFAKESGKFALMSTYEQRLNRSLHKNLATLRELQAERKDSFQRDLNEEIHIARANDLKGLSYKAPTRPGPNGFVFSTAEILSAANRDSILYAARAKVGLPSCKIQFDGAYESFDPNRPNSGLSVAQAA